MQDEKFMKAKVTGGFDMICYNPRAESGFMDILDVVFIFNDVMNIMLLELDANKDYSMPICMFILDVSWD